MSFSNIFTLPQTMGRRIMAMPVTPRVRFSRTRRGGQVFAMTALVTSLAACNTIPKADNTQVLAQPNVPINQSYGVYDSSTASSGQQPSIASERWQDYYSDTRLKQLIALGLENNKDLESALLAIRRSRAQYQITDIEDVPTIDGSGSYSRSANNATDKNPSNSYGVNLAMSSYELDFWGRISSLKDEALQNFLATTAAKDAAQISLISNIAQGYINLSYSMAQLQLAEATVKTREESLFINQKRFEAGIDAKTPLLQAEAALESAKLSVYTAQTNLLQSRNALQLLIGQPIPNELVPSAAVSQITSDRIFNAGLPSELLRYRPDILQAEYSLKAAGANIDAARAAYFPTISLSGQAGLSSGDLDNLFETGSFSWSFGPSISLPIFDAGALDASYEIAQIDRDSALVDYESAIQTAFREVSDVLATRATLTEQLASQYKLQDNYQETYNISDARFKAGIDTYLEVLDAQRSLFSNQQSILNLELERLTSQIELYEALGGGANVGEPVAIPIAEHRNLTHLIIPSSREARAEHAVAAATTATVATPEQAAQLAEEQARPVRNIEKIADVDLNDDGEDDAAVGILTE